MKVAQVNGRRFVVMDSPLGPGGTTAQPSFEDLTDVDMTGITDGEVPVWDAGTSTWLPGAGGGSASLPWSYAQADGGLVGDGTTDDTVAFQAWIDSETASGTQSAWFWFEPGTYLIGGALQDTGAFNGQILLPNVPIDASHPEIILHFCGPTRPPFAVVPTQNVPDPNGYAIIESSLTGASGTASCISGGNTTYNNISVVVEDLICIAPANPTFTFWNLQNSQGATIQDVMIWTTDWLGGTLPTHSNSYGIKLPGDTQGNYTRVEGLSVRNFYTGVRDGDLVVATGVQLSVCIVGWERPAGSWPSLLIDVYLNGCLYGIRGTGGDSVLDVLRYSHEHYPSDPTYATVYDLDDPSDYIHGAFRWWDVEWSVGPDHIFSVNSAANTSNAEIGPLGSGSGTVTSVALTVPAEFSVSGSPVTTSGTLAITKANESSNTVWAGPTSGAAAAPAFRALVAADIPSGVGTTDHEHIMDVLMDGDASTTAFELPAAPFDAYSVQAFVAGTLTEVTLSGALLTTATFGSAPGSGTGNIRFDIVAAVA